MNLIFDVSVLITCDRRFHPKCNVDFLKEAKNQPSPTRITIEKKYRT